MADDSSKKDLTPGWYADGLGSVWLPYAQMKTASPPLPVVRTQGSRIVLADGRELIDGVASWWTACHGYNQPHIRQAVERQLRDMPHVMFGGLAHEQALLLARRLAALLPGDLTRVFFSDSGSIAAARSSLSGTSTIWCCGSRRANSACMPPSASLTAMAPVVSP